MTPVNFCYWLQGYFELSGSKEPLTAEQTDLIRRHLNLVFYHSIDPSFPALDQDALNAIHSGSAPAPAPAPVSDPPVQVPVRPQGFNMLHDQHSSTLVRC